MSTGFDKEECVYYGKIFNKHNEETDSKLAPNHCQIDINNPSLTKPYIYRLPILNEASSENIGNAQSDSNRVCKNLRSAIIKTSINSNDESIIESREKENLPNTSKNSAIYSTYRNRDTKNQEHYCDLDILNEEGETSENMSRSILNDSTLLMNFMQKFKSKMPLDTSTVSIENDRQNTDILPEKVKHHERRRRSLSKHKESENTSRNKSPKHSSRRKRRPSKEIVNIDQITLPGGTQKDQDVYYLVMGKKHEKDKSKMPENSPTRDSNYDIPEKDILTNTDIMKVINEKLINSAGDSVKSEAIKQHIYENALKSKKFRNCVLDKTISLEVLNKLNIDKIMNSASFRKANIKSFENFLENSSKISKEPDVCELHSEANYKDTAKKKETRHHHHHHRREKSKHKSPDSHHHRKRQRRSSSTQKDSKNLSTDLTLLDSHNKNRSKSNERRRRKKKSLERLVKSRNKSKYRKEISFTELNLTPVLDFYKSSLQIPPEPSKRSRKKRESSTNSLNDVDSSKLTKRSSSKSSATKRYEKFRRKIRNKSDKRSSVSEIVTRKEKNKHKLQHHILANYFDHAQLKRSVYSKKKVISTDRLLEISTKSLGEDGSTALGFTVEGIEPPKRLEPKVRHETDPYKYAEALKKLHFTYFPVLEVKPNAIILSRPASCLDLLKRSFSKDIWKHSNERALSVQTEIIGDVSRDKPCCESTTQDTEEQTIGETSSTSQEQKKKIRKLIKYTMQKRIKGRDLRCGDKVEHDKKQRKNHHSEKEKKSKKTKKAPQKSKEIKKSEDVKTQKEFCFHDSLPTKIGSRSSSTFKTEKNVSNLEIINEESQSHYSSTDTDARNKLQLNNKRLTQSSSTVKQTSDFIDKSETTLTSSCTTSKLRPSQIPKLKSNYVPSKLKQTQFDHLYKLLCDMTNEKISPIDNIEDSLDKLIKYLEEMKETKKNLPEDKSCVTDRRNDSPRFNRTSKSSCSIYKVPSKTTFNSSDKKEDSSGSVLNLSQGLPETNCSTNPSIDITLDSSSQHQNVSQTYAIFKDKRKREEEKRAQAYYNSPEFREKMAKFGFTEEDLNRESPDGEMVYGFNTPGFSCLSVVCCMCRKMLTCCENKPLAVEESEQCLAETEKKPQEPDESKPFKMPTIIRPVKSVHKSQKIVQTNITLTNEVNSPFKASSKSTVCSLPSTSPRSSVSFIDKKKVVKPAAHKTLNDSTSEDAIQNKPKMKRNRLRKKNTPLSKAISITGVPESVQVSPQDKTKSSQPFLVMSTTSSYTVCSNPSDFLAKVESQLKNDRKLLNRKNKVLEEVVKVKSSGLDFKSRLFTHDSFSHLDEAATDEDFLIDDNFMTNYWKYLSSSSAKRRILNSVRISEESLNTIINIFQKESRDIFPNGRKPKKIQNKHRTMETISKLFGQNGKSVLFPQSASGNSFFLHPRMLTKDEVDFSVDSLDGALTRRKRYPKPRSCMTFQRPAPNTYFVYNTTIETKSPFKDSKDGGVAEQTTLPSTNPPQAVLSATQSTDMSTAQTSEESGYESNKTKKYGLKSFFTKGALMDLFKMKRKNKKKFEGEKINVVSPASSTDVDQNDLVKSDIDTQSNSNKKRLSSWTNVGKKIYKFANESDNSCKLRSDESNSTISVTSSKKSKIYTININSSSKNTIKRFSDFNSDTDQSSKGLDDIPYTSNKNLDTTPERNEETVTAEVHAQPEIKKPNIYTITFNQSKTTIKSFADIGMKMVQQKEFEIKQTHQYQNLKAKFLKMKEARNKVDDPAPATILEETKEEEIVVKSKASLITLVDTVTNDSQPQQIRKTLPSKIPVIKNKKSLTKTENDPKRSETPIGSKTKVRDAEKALTENVVETVYFNTVTSNESKISGDITHTIQQPKHNANLHTLDKKETIRNNDCSKKDHLKVKLEQALNIMNSKENFSVTSLDVQYFKNLIEKSNSNEINMEDKINLLNKLSQMYSNLHQNLCKYTSSDLDKIQDDLSKLLASFEDAPVTIRQPFSCKIYNIEEKKQALCNDYCSLQPKICTKTDDNTTNFEQETIAPKKKTSYKSEKAVKINVSKSTGSKTCMKLKPKKSKEKTLKPSSKEKITESRRKKCRDKACKPKSKEKDKYKILEGETSKIAKVPDDQIPQKPRKKKLEEPTAFNPVESNQVHSCCKSICKGKSHKGHKRKHSKPLICDKKTCYEEFKKTYLPPDVEQEQSKMDTTDGISKDAESIIVEEDDAVQEDLREYVAEDKTESGEKVLRSMDKDVLKYVENDVLIKLPPKHIFIGDKGEDINFDLDLEKAAEKKDTLEESSESEDESTKSEEGYPKTSKRVYDDNEIIEEWVEEEKEEAEEEEKEETEEEEAEEEKEEAEEEKEEAEEEKEEAEEEEKDEEIEEVEEKEVEKEEENEDDHDIGDHQSFEIEYDINDSLTPVLEMDISDVTFFEEEEIPFIEHNLDGSSRLKFVDSRELLEKEWSRRDIEELHDHRKKKHKRIKRTKEVGCNCDGLKKKNKKCQCISDCSKTAHLTAAHQRAKASVSFNMNKINDDDDYINLPTKRTVDDTKVSIESTEKRKTHTKRNKKLDKDAEKSEKKKSRKKMENKTTSTPHKQSCTERSCKEYKFISKGCQCNAFLRNKYDDQNTCNCQALRLYTKQIQECQEYAAKIRLESEMKKEGYWKQYADFREIPLHVLLGRAPPTSVSIPRREIKEVEQIIKENDERNLHKISLIPDQDINPIIIGSTKYQPDLENLSVIISNDEIAVKESEPMPLSDSFLKQEFQKDKSKKQDEEADEAFEESSIAVLGSEKKMSSAASEAFGNVKSSLTNLKHSDGSIKFVDPMDREKEAKPKSSFINATETITLTRSKKKTDADVKKLFDSGREIISRDSDVELETPGITFQKVEDTNIKINDNQQEEEADKEEADKEEADKEEPERQPTIEDVRKNLTDKEIFNKLLSSYEKEENLAQKLSFDETFFESQLTTVKSKESASNFLKDETVKQTFQRSSDYVDPQDIGSCFSRGFRPHNITLTGDACLNVGQERGKGSLEENESIIDFSERDTPLDYLLGLGFMVDEATNALKDEDVEHRLLAAITEARVWINQISTTQGTLLYLVAYKAKPKTMRYFLQLVEAIINKRITNAVKLNGFLRVLEKIEQGEIGMLRLFNDRQFEDEENEERLVKTQLREIFMMVYKAAEHEAFARGKRLSKEAVMLLRILSAKYRAGLNPHLELIATYIGRNLLKTEIQLEAAMIFLSRLDTAEVKIKEFEKYCDLVE